MMLSDSLLKFCKEKENEDIYSLALQSDKYPDIDIQKATQQIKGLQIAKNKLPSWYSVDNIVYPPQLSLEQCSSEYTALYKASICGEGDTIVDLTGGFGVDISFISPQFKKAIYIEQQEALVEYAKHNFGALGLESIVPVQDDAIDYLNKMECADLIYIDPARRDIKGRKTFLIEDCSPDILAIQSVLDEKSKKVIIKLSPMLDISLALESLTNITSVHIVSVDNECKELLFIKENGCIVDEPKLHCINISKNDISKFTYLKSEEENTNGTYALTVNVFIYEPNTSILKAGAYKLVGARFGLQKLHPSSHLYTSHALISSFPGRIFKVKAVSTQNKKELKKNLANITKANVSTRNFPLKAEELKKKLALKDGGCTYIFGTTLFDNRKVLIICEKV